MSRKTKRLVTLLITPLAGLALASCSGGAAGGAQSEPPAETTPDSYVEITDQQGSVEGFVGASDDAQITLCEEKGNLWLAEGEVTNPTDATQSYRLYVGFNEGRDTKGLVQVDLPSVTPGETATWDVEAPIAADDAECVLRVERFTP